MARVALGLGSNLGGRASNLQYAIEALAALEHVDVVAISSLYETPPWGGIAQQDFLNQCVQIDTALAPQTVLDACLAIETQLGRIRDQKWGPRTLDIDLLVWDGPDISTPTLTLPHPYAHERAFVLVPLIEIAPAMRLNGQPLQAHLERLPTTDRAMVRRYES